MHIGALATLILAPLVLGQTPLYVSTPPNATSGVPVNVTYTAPDMSQPVTILLLKGDPSNLSTVGVLTDDQKTSPYTWIPAASLQPANNYALEITQGNVTNYSAEFSIFAGSVSAIPSTSSASPAMASMKSSTYSSSLSTVNASSTATSMSSVLITGLNVSITATGTPFPSATAAGLTSTSASQYNMTTIMTTTPVLPSAGITASPNVTRTKTRHYNTTSICTSVASLYSNEAAIWNGPRPWVQAVAFAVIGAIGL